MKQTEFTIWFKYMLVSRGTSYRVLGAAIGYSATYLSDLANGNRMPTDGIVQRLISFYNLNDDEQRVLYDCVASSIDRLPFDVEKFLKDNPDILEDIKNKMREQNLSGGGR